MVLAFKNTLLTSRNHLSLKSQKAVRYAQRGLCRVVRGEAESEAVDVEPIPSDILEAEPNTTPKEFRNTGPNPEKFKVQEGTLGKIIAASFPLVLRAGSGAVCSGYKVELEKDEGQNSYTFLTAVGNRVKETSEVYSFTRPEVPIEMYEFEGCPFCKKVREAVSILDLDVIFYPCPQGGTTWRPMANDLGGQKQFPYMVDPNTGVAMYESDAIIQYMFGTYGDGSVPRLLDLGMLTTMTAGLGLLPRMGSGSRARASIIPEEPVVLWGYEASPFVKVVREILCELEIPYLLKTCARGSSKRNEMLDKAGHFQVPYLEDPNTGEAMFESAYIVEYLEKTYAK